MTDDFWDATGTGSRLDLRAFFDSDVLQRLVDLLELGALISFGLTRDSGAIGLAVFDDGRRRREYFRDSHDAVEWLGRAQHAISGNGLGDSVGSRPASRKPTRGA